MPKFSTTCSAIQKHPLKGSILLMMLFCLLGNKAMGQSYQLSGKVMNAENKKTLEKVEVRLFQYIEKNDKIFLQEQDKKLFTQDDGEFTLSLETQHKYEIYCMKEGYVVCKKTFDKNKVAANEHINMPFFMDKGLSLVLVGEVKNEATLKTLGYAELSIQNMTTKELLRVRANESGIFKCPLEKDNVYEIWGQKENYYVSPPKQYSTFKIENEENMRLEIQLREIAMGQTTRLQSFDFDINDSLVNAALAKELEELLSLLKQNPRIKIEISTHTDSRGDDAHNLALSQSRANSIVRYLLDKGIDPKRLVAMGYGETKLVNQCENGVKCSNALHLQNRRVEYKIIDFLPSE